MRVALTANRRQLDIDTTILSCYAAFTLADALFKASVTRLTEKEAASRQLKYKTETRIKRPCRTQNLLLKSTLLRSYYLRCSPFLSFLS